MLFPVSDHVSVIHKFINSVGLIGLVCKTALIVVQMNFVAYEV